MSACHALRALCLPLLLGSCSASTAPHNELLPLLVAIEQRLELARSVAHHKWEHALAVDAPAREQQVLAQVRRAAPDYGLSPERAETFFADQIEANKLVQYALLDRWAARGQNSLSSTRDLTHELRPRLDSLQFTLLNELAALDRQPPADCPRALANALIRRTQDPLHHLALIRATGQLCKKH
ncbi:gamma subclass chorismate mutase AroQ [Pseudomonas sp. NY15463]|uniref:gamma subclass chorismate mutase AroQ n=1 Tax=Pseudomonas sp. NY15463 TaxID=3400361 RepID=UPI003A87490D